MLAPHDVRARFSCFPDQDHRDDQAVDGDAFGQPDDDHGPAEQLRPLADRCQGRRAGVGDRDRGAEGGAGDGDGGADQRRLVVDVDAAAAGGTAAAADGPAASAIASSASAASISPALAARTTRNDGRDAGAAATRLMGRPRPRRAGRSAKRAWRLHADGRAHGNVPGPERSALAVEDSGEQLVVLEPQRLNARDQSLQRQGHRVADRRTPAPRRRPGQPCLAAPGGGRPRSPGRVPRGSRPNAARRAKD